MLLHHHHRSTTPEWILRRTDFNRLDDHIRTHGYGRVLMRVSMTGLSPVTGPYRAARKSANEAEFKHER